jgi:hypothetical protein
MSEQTANLILASVYIIGSACVFIFCCFLRMLGGRALRARETLWMISYVIGWPIILPLAFIYVTAGHSK